MPGERQPKFSATNMNIYKLISTDLVPFPYMCQEHCLSLNVMSANIQNILVLKKQIM
jgi:hypothetical protein